MDNSNKVKWIEQDGEKISIRKSFGAWRVVYPFKNQDGTMNWKNTLFPGGWDGIIRWLLILGLILLFYSAYAHDTRVCRETMANFETECAKLNYITSNINNTPREYQSSLNLSLIKFGDVDGT